MKVKKLNTRFIVGLLAALAVLGLGTYLLHAVQVKRNARGLLRQADLAESQGNLRKASAYLSSYLGHVAEDTDALCRYGLILKKVAETPPQRSHALNVLEKVLRRQRDDAKARRHAIRLSLDLERFGNARDHLKTLEEGGADDCAFHLLYGRCEEGAGQTSAALEHYAKAVQEAQRDREAYRAMDSEERIEVYLRPAWLRMKQLALSLHDAKKPAVADQQKAVREERAVVVGLLEALGREYADAYQSYLARSRSWRALATLLEQIAADPLSQPSDDAQAKARKGELEEAKQKANDNAKRDIGRAEELARDEAPVILAAAELDQQEGRLDEARQRLAHGFQLHPASVPMYRGAAALEIKDGRRLAAIGILRRGLQAVPADVNLLWDLTELLIQENQLAEAEETRKRLRKAGGAGPLVAYLSARIVLQEGRWCQAVSELEDVQPRLKGWPELQAQVDLALGRCWEQLGEPDQQYTVYRRLLAADPRSTAATVGVAKALVAMNKIDEAIDTYLRILPFEPNVRLEMARLLTLQNLQSPAGQRQWRRVEQLLEEAERLTPKSSDVVLLRAEVLAARKEFQQAADLLNAARDADPDRVELWTGLAAVTDRKSGPEAALAILDEAQRQLGDVVELRLARARHWLRQPPEKAKAAVTALAEQMHEFSTEDRRRLLRGVAQAVTQLNDLNQARQAWTRVAKEHPQDLGARLVLFDLAVLANDEAGVRQAQMEIERLQGPEGSFARHAKACELLVQVRKDPVSRESKKQLAEARNHLTAVAARRPYWARVRVRQAEVEELLGNSEAAITHYQEAILRQGENTPVVVTRLIQLLRERQRFAEADTVLAKFQDQRAVRDSLNRYEAESLIRKQNYTRAVDLAQQAVPADSRDAQDQLWLGKILWLAGRAGPAETALRRAVELGGSQPGPWLALVQFLVAVDRKANALEVVRDAQAALAADQGLTLARCYEVVGEQLEAEKLYKSAAASGIAGQRALAGFYLRTGRTTEAEPLLRTIIERSGKSPQDQEWARRALAILLATKRDYQQMREALGILGVLDSADPNQAAGTLSTEDQRLRAILLATHQGRKQRLEAIRLLEDLGRRQTDADQFLLAQLYETTGDWPRAREKMLGLLADEDSHLEQPLQHLQHLASYVTSLLRHGQADEAEVWLKQLAQRDQNEPQMFVTVALKARLLHAQKKGDAVVPLLKDYAEKRPPDLGRVAALLDELGQDAAAEVHYRKYVAQAQKPQAPLALAEFLARKDRLSEALDIWDRAWGSVQPDTLATVSVQLLYTANSNADQQQRVALRLEDALKKQPASPVLLGQLAAVRNLQGRYDDVIRLYRQVVERDPRDALALNNLAWFLALTEGKPTEAMVLIQRAIDLKGPQASLLETRAAICSAMGKHDLALKDLNAVITDDPSGPVYFRLAHTHYVAGNRLGAAQALQEAKRRGFKIEDLHALERPACDQLLRELASR
jgi:predicted Zn-dependent protease